MQDVDAFFTQTVVGGPQTVFLGRRVRPQTTQSPGLQINLAQGHAVLDKRWCQDLWLLEHAAQPAGHPRRRPGRWRARLERYALLIALSGLVMGAAALILLVAQAVS